MFWQTWVKYLEVLNMISRFAENSDSAIDSHICTSETFENLMLELGDEVRDWCLSLIHI